MKRSQSLQLTILLIFSLSTLAAKDIIGYLPSWRFMERDTLVSQATIPYEKLTIINYAFFYPTPEGDLLGLHPEADDFLLNDLTGKHTGKPLPNTSLIDYAERYNVKVMVSIGGWEDSGNFPEVASSEAKRTNFASSCINLIRKYGFHGIDIDWEYPGLEAHNGSPADYDNFSLLLTVLRDSLDAHSDETELYYPLSFAAPASPVVAKGFDVGAISEILDFINIMTYDFHGVWDSESNHNSPLFAKSGGSVDQAFRLYHENYGVPAEKLNLGVPFYGRTFDQCRKIYGKHSGASTYFHPEGFADYQMLENNGAGFKRKWDDNAKVPYFVNRKKKILVSYDDAESVGYKADYILDNNVRGVIIWTIVGDYLENGDTPLLNVLHEKLDQK
jgi:chitinase